MGRLGVSGRRAGRGSVALRDSGRETLANLSITGHLRGFSDQAVAEIVQCGERVAVTHVRPREHRGAVGGRPVASEGPSKRRRLEGVLGEGRRLTRVNRCPGATRLAKSAKSFGRVVAIGSGERAGALRGCIKTSNARLRLLTPSYFIGTRAFSSSVQLRTTWTCSRVNLLSCV
jgi:hypothetical protein